MGARADQIITGTAITLGSVGLTGAIYRSAYGPQGVGLSLPTFPVLPIPGLSKIPVIGPALFQQSVLTYVGYLAVPVLWWLLFRTPWGLKLRAAGESAENARAAGVRVSPGADCRRTGGWGIRRAGGCEPGAGDRWAHSRRR